MFTHLLEFRLLFGCVTPPPPPTETFAVLSIPSQFTVDSLPSAGIEELDDLITQTEQESTLASESMHTKTQPGVTPGYSDLFLSTTGSSPSPELSEIPSFMEAINNSKQSLHEKRSTLLALSEVPSYESSERVPRSTKSIKSAVTSVTDVHEEELEQIEDLIVEKKRKRSKSGGSRKGRRSSIMKKRKSSKRRNTTVKIAKSPKKSIQKSAKKKVPDAKSEKSVKPKSEIMSFVSEDIPSVEIAQMTEQEFEEVLREINTLDDDKERLMLLVPWADLVSDSKTSFLFIKTLDEFLNPETTMKLTDNEADQVEDVIVNLFEQKKIDCVHLTELLRSLMTCDMDDFKKFNTLCTMIKIHRSAKAKASSSHGPEMKTVLMEILPFLVHEDEEIKDQAFDELCKFADINTKDELRDLLVTLGIISADSSTDDIEIISNGKILNIQYWRNKIENPVPNSSSKVSEEIQIVSEFEIQVEPSSLKKPESRRRSTKPAIRRSTTRKSIPNIPDQHPLNQIVEEKKSPRPPPKQPSVTPTDYQETDPYLDHEVDLEYPEYQDGESEEEPLVSIPSIDIKRRIMNYNGKPIKDRGQTVGVVQDQGKVYNSTNDLMMWFHANDDQFYDPKTRRVGSLLPNGDVQVPDDVNLVLDSYIVNLVSLEFYLP